MNRIFTCGLLLAVSVASRSVCRADVVPQLSEAPVGKWIKLFDGKSLNSWTSLDRSFFSVSDGAITGETTKEHNPKELLFIVHQGGEARDFELNFKFRMFGSKANSGMQFRSKLMEKGQVHGYQADMAMEGPYTGGLWDEFSPRGSLAGRGERTVYDEQGKRSATRFAPAADLLGKFDLGHWNTYSIKADGHHITLAINGIVTADLTDNQVDRMRDSGIFAMAVIPGEPMKVQFKDIRFKRLR